MEYHVTRPAIAPFGRSRIKTILLLLRSWARSLREAWQRAELKSNYLLLPFLTNANKLQSSRFREIMEKTEQEYRQLTRKGT